MRRYQPLPPREALLDKLHYNSITGIFTWGGSARSDFIGLRAGTINNQGYIIIRFKGRKSYPAHRLAYRIMTGDEPPDAMDHIDGNRINNAWTNLRLASSCENAQNRKNPANNTSGIKGVSYNKRQRKWGARIGHNGQCIFLGWFATKEDAACARHEAAVRLYGPYIHVNDANQRLPFYAASPNCVIGYPP